MKPKRPTTGESRLRQKSQELKGETKGEKTSMGLNQRQRHSTVISFDDGKEGKRKNSCRTRGCRGNKRGGGNQSIRTKRGEAVLFFSERYRETLIRQRNLPTGFREKNKVGETPVKHGEENQ